MSAALDYPAAPPAGIDPAAYRDTIIAAMQRRYKIALLADDEQAEVDEETRDMAMATWDTEWPDDPQPRDLKAAMDVVDDDLHYWAEG